MWFFINWYCVQKLYASNIHLRIRIPHFCKKSQNSCTLLIILFCLLLFRLLFRHDQIAFPAPLLRIGPAWLSFPGCFFQLLSASFSCCLLLSAVVCFFQQLSASFSCCLLFLRLSVPFSCSLLLAAVVCSSQLLSAPFSCCLLLSAVVCSFQLLFVPFRCCLLLSAVVYSFQLSSHSSAPLSCCLLLSFSCLILSVFCLYRDRILERHFQSRFLAINSSLLRFEFLSGFLPAFFYSTKCYS